MKNRLNNQNMALKAFLSLFLTFSCAPLFATEFASRFTPACSYQLTPPKGFDMFKERDKLQDQVEAVFIGKASRGFIPSINLTRETTSLSIEEYVRLTKTYHASLPDTQCFQLDDIQTEGGRACLLQIEKKIPNGNVRFLQSLFIHDQTAYVLTATCKNEDFANLAPLFYQSMKSLQINQKKG